MPNHLSNSESPYLRQHAGNPVDWWPWCDAAFALARERDVPVLVSIGYATCHWCHVMAHECFEDPATAAAMNRQLVCIKVDREEHPEVDAIFMDAVVALHGHGGWPLNAFATPEGKPFFAVTYLPRERWTGLVGHLAGMWAGDREKVLGHADELTRHLQAEDRARVGTLDPAVWTKLDAQLADAYDREHPGIAWGPAKQPKFPPSQLLHLLLGDRDPGRRAIAVDILTAMQDAGIHDRVGGGFHRYAVDRPWRVPHFEKMLYDNGQLIGAYARAAVLTDRADLLATARHAADYLDRDLAIASGGAFLGYAAAEDADDPGGEGSFYAWSPADLAAALGADAGARLAADWDLAPGHPEIGPSGHAEPVASHIPHPRGTGRDLAPLRAGWESDLPVLRAARDRRPRPGRDGKVITAWNGLALEGLSWLARATGDPTDAARVQRLADPLRRRITGDGLWRLPDRPGVLDDHGALAAGLMAAFAACGDPLLVEAAAQVVDLAIAGFRAPDGGFFTAPAGRSDLVRRGREHLDNATPAGIGSLALACARLWAVTGEARWRDTATAAIAAASAEIAAAPANAATLLDAWRAIGDGPLVAVVAGAAEDPRQAELLAAVRRVAHPSCAIVPLATCRNRAWTCLDGRRDLSEPAVLVCTATACLAPARTADEVRNRLG